MERPRPSYNYQSAKVPISHSFFNYASTHHTTRAIIIPTYGTILTPEVYPKPKPKKIRRHTTNSPQRGTKTTIKITAKTKTRTKTKTTYNFTYSLPKKTTTHPLLSTSSYAPLRMSTPQASLQSLTDRHKRSLH